MSEVGDPRVPPEDHAVAGPDLIPPARRDEAYKFRKDVGFAFAGFIEAQVALGAVYGLWAVVVCVLLGIPHAAAAGFLAGVTMAIPIYGPFVSWLPPVLIAAVVTPDVAVLCLVLMLVGWFIDENVLAPLVRAGAVDLHPIVVTIAFLMGAQMAGAIGALISIPIAAILTSFFRFYFDRYRTARGWTEVDLPTDGKAPAPAIVQTEVTR
jgi:predicted PurR-regulated permease PerM